MRQTGKYGLEWSRVKAELKEAFDRDGIRYCEAHFMGCTTYPDGFAHTRKRRHLGKWGSEERHINIREVVLLCNHCHDVLEMKGERIMLAELKRLINSREPENFFEGL